MAQPTPFNRSADYSDDEANSVGGRSTVVTASLDAELDDIATTLSETLANLALIQRDDGDIRDGEVKLHTLSAQVKALIAAAGANIRGDWVTATEYAVNDVVVESGATYICATAHTSGTFNTDLTADKWVLLMFSPSALAASGVSVTPAGSISATDVQDALEELDSEKLAVANDLSDVNDAPTALSNLGALAKAGGTMTGLLVLSANPTAALGAAPKQYVDAAIAGLSFGQCYFELVGTTQCKLVRKNGTKLFIDGEWRTIPSAGVTLSNGGLSANTFYYVYAYMSGGTMTLEASTTARATDATYGHQIENGDSSRTLVGAVHMDASTQFSDGATNKRVLSWFNRRKKAGTNAFTTGRTFTGASAAEIHTEVRINFITWDDDDPFASMDCRVSNSNGGQAAYAYLSIDGTVVSGAIGGHSSSSGYQNGASAAKFVAGLTENALHYVTIKGSVSANTGTVAAEGSTSVAISG